MNFKDVIYTRRSVRRYLDRTVDKETIEQLIGAAVQAPSAMNTQPWVFAVVRDKALLKDISDKCKAYLLRALDRMPALEQYRPTLQDPEFNIFYNAPALVLVCSKPNLSPEPRTDCALAAENLMLMARELGLGTVWIGFAYGFLNTPEGKQMLGVPSDYGVEAPIIVGYPEAEMTTMERNAPEVLFWK